MSEREEWRMEIGEWRLERVRERNERKRDERRRKREETRGAERQEATRGRETRDKRDEQALVPGREKGTSERDEGRRREGPTRAQAVAERGRETSRSPAGIFARSLVVEYLVRVLERYACRAPPLLERRRRLTVGSGQRQMWPVLDRVLAP
jgi:hypothetical protein